MKLLIQYLSSTVLSHVIGLRAGFESDFSVRYEGYP